MDIFQSIVIAIVEGLTEFLPVSSTGHMIIAENVLGVEPDDFTKAFTVIIQFGAILSVIWLYYKRFFKLNPVPEGVTGFKAFITRYDFYWKLFVAFIPAAVFGLLFSDLIDSLLESVLVVAIMLVVGGVLMLFVDKWFTKVEDDNEKISERQAVKIGLFQCIAMIPGVSRSMATIVGGMQQGLSRKTAAEFSFFLAVPTMFAAMAYKMLKLFINPESRALLAANWDVLLIGNVVAFIVAILAIKFFINFLTKYGFKAFGYYRIIVGGAIIIMMLCNVNLQIS
ncbi:MAG: undecaprenyl-diphosphate phosphatase [Bacteroidales bacterium]|nr:undecaprenyl-diphosphate phosphatase [Bacteroidales bacterium]MDY2932020.1 undecaprenyl-diphosphate phosphatase [Muribaculaceae bacterium]MDY5118897.1 undecaprenyl-diphosphate phosphatase [Muribaculaceae bacterium]